MNINKQGVITNINFTNSLINNFTHTKSTTGWSLGGSLDSNGNAILTGTAPNIQSPTFTVNPDEILVVEFDVNMTSPSSSGDGLYLGTQANSNTILYNYNNGWNSGEDNSNTGASWNTYFISGFKSSSDTHVKGYILGSNASLSSITENIANGTRAVKLKTGTTTFLRSGYNTNTTMTLKFWNPVVYKLVYNNYTAGFTNIDIRANELIEI